MYVCVTHWLIFASLEFGQLKRACLEIACLWNKKTCLYDHKKLTVLDINDGAASIPVERLPPLIVHFAPKQIIRHRNDDCYWPLSSSAQPSLSHPPPPCLKHLMTRMRTFFVQKVQMFKRNSGLPFTFKSLSIIPQRASNCLIRFTNSKCTKWALLAKACFCWYGKHCDFYPLHLVFIKNMRTEKHNFLQFLWALKPGGVHLFSDSWVMSW